MMTGYWYWRADQLETSKRRDCDERELLAGAQAEDNSIYTIREKCYVLTPSAFARYALWKIDNTRRQFSGTIIVLLQNICNCPICFSFFLAIM